MRNRNSLKEILYKWIRGVAPERISSVRIEKYTLECGYSAENGRRRVREMVKDGLLKMDDSKGWAEYWYEIPPQKTLQEQEVESEEILRASLC